LTNNPIIITDAASTTNHSSLSLKYIDFGIRGYFFLSKNSDKLLSMIPRTK
jgi:hypothetical protein